jgi:hypothetical protein
MGQKAHHRQAYVYTGLSMMKPHTPSQTLEVQGGAFQQTVQQTAVHCPCNRPQPFNHRVFITLYLPSQPI